MLNFILGIITSLIATGLIALVKKFAWPTFRDKCLYKGIRVEGKWDIIEIRNGKNVNVGNIELTQHGRLITGISSRRKTRDGKHSDRSFKYHGSIDGHQVTLIFEDKRGVGFDTGTYVFTVLNDSKTMLGMTTFHGKTENRIVSEPRTLKKIVS